MADFAPPRKPQEATLGEFIEWQELLAEAGKQVIAVDDALIAATHRQADRAALRRNAGVNPDAVGRGPR